MTTADRTTRDADPWWGETDQGLAPGFDVPVAANARRGRRRASSKRAPLWLRVLRLPFVAFARAVRRSPRLRKTLTRLVILGIVALGIAGSVGVILLNNIVINRTAELGELDQERRELRRDNAVLDAQAAMKSSQTVIMNKAEKQLGMRRASGAPIYTYLEPASSNFAAKQRAARAAKAARLAAAARVQAGKEKAR